MLEQILHLVVAQTVDKMSTRSAKQAPLFWRIRPLYPLGIRPLYPSFFLQGIRPLYPLEDKTPLFWRIRPPYSGG